MARDAPNATTGPSAPLAWFTSGVARFILIVTALAVVTAPGIVLALTGKITGTVAYTTISGAALLVLGAMLNQSGARQMADAKNGSGDPPLVPPAGT